MNKDRAEFQLAEKHFPSIYLTLIALIQGIALSILAENFVDDIKGINDILDIIHKSIYWERYFISGMLIFTVWHHYLHAVIYLRWLPGILDTLLPLLLGTMQLVMAGGIREMHPSLWLFFLAMFSFIASLAYYNAVIKTKPNLFSSHYEKKNSDEYCCYIHKCHGAAGIHCFILATSASILLIFDNTFHYNFVYLFSVLLVLHIVFYEIYYMTRIKPLFISMEEHRKVREPWRDAKCALWWTQDERRLPKA